MIGAVRTIEADVIQTEDEGTDGPRLCQVIMVTYPSALPYPEEVCTGHIEQPGRQWCGDCANDGRSVPITITVMGRI